MPMSAVTDALNRHWPQWQDSVALTRLNRPIGSYLLLGPTLWPLWIAAQVVSYWHMLMILSLGVFLICSVGCIINDFADRKVDGHVYRTKYLPLAAGLLTARQALQGFALLVVLAFLLV